MTTDGVVREWWPEEGWGVIDSDETPGGCWVHYSALRMRGYRGLAVGDRVQMDVERADQDGYAFRSERLWLAGTEPVDDVIEVRGPSSAYRSSLTISFDGPEVSVREASAGDLAAAVDVWRSARVAAGAPPSETRVERVRAKVRDPGSLVVVAEARDGVVAMAQLEAFRDDPATAHVSMVFVEPSHQGRGVGRALLEGAHFLARARGWTSSSLWTRESNAAARALYARVGYRPTDEVGATPSGEPMRRWVR
jgi:cold shock protein